MGSSTRRLLFGLQALFWFSGLFIRAVGAQDCPIYREFNEERPNAKQYGAPDGCACVDGMSGVNCGFCESDDPCKAVNSSHVCRKGMVYSQEDSYKAYSCYLTDTLEKLFTNGKVDIFMNTTTRSAKMVIYNGASINDGHAIDCFLSGCTFKAGERSGECANVGTCSIGVGTSNK